MSSQDSNNIESFSWLFAFLAAAHAVLFLSLGSLFSFLAVSVFILVLLVNIFFFKPVSNRFRSHILNSSFIAYAAFLCWKTGGFFSVAMTLLFLVPVFSTVFENIRTRIAYIAVSTVLFLAFYLDQRLALSLFSSPGMINISLYRLYNLGAVLICFYLAVMINSRNSDQSSADLRQSEMHSVQVSEQAEQALKVKDQFLANMSHEIRNPMNGIIGMMHVLLDSDLDEEQKEYAEVVYNSARALLTIVNDILDLSKIEAGKMELDNRDFHLDISIKDIVALPSVQARQKGIDFVYSIDPEIPCLLNGDIGRIRQIINNLTGNAIKFTESGEVILSVSLQSEEPDQVVLYFKVEDTGIGVPEDKLASLFESFNQADLSITKKYGGTGLGLTISKMLVEMMGGQIGVESIEMIGSTFWFTLRLRKQTQKEVSAVSLPGKDISGCRVLVLGDTSSLGMNFENNLNDLEIDYEQAFDVTEAVEMLKWSFDGEDPFDIVILEAKESDSFAKECGRKIKSDDTFSQVRLMILSAVGKKGDAKLYEDLGFYAFLSKPVEKAVFEGALKAVLCAPEKEQGNRPIITKFTILESKKTQSRILIVDDMKTNLLTARTLISKLGYITDTAENGQEAVEKHEQNTYDLILMDCQMPVMDGFRATEKIRENEKSSGKDRVPVIAMTGNAFQKDQEKCFQAGMDDFIAKPVEPDILFKKIDAYLEKAAAVGKMENRIQADTSETAMESVPVQVEQENDDIPCFDDIKLHERFGGDEELIQIVVESFFEEVPELLERLEKAVEKEDNEETRSCAHALKGSAANVNAERLRAAALELENLAKQGEKESFSAGLIEIREQFNQFEQAIHHD